MAAMITTINFYVYISKNVELKFKTSNTATKRKIFVNIIRLSLNPIFMRLLFNHSYINVNKSPIEINYLNKQFWLIYRTSYFTFIKY